MIKYKISCYIHFNLKTSDIANMTRWGPDMTNIQLGNDDDDDWETEADFEVYFTISYTIYDLPCNVYSIWCGRYSHNLLYHLCTIKNLKNTFRMMLLRRTNGGDQRLLQSH